MLKIKEKINDSVDTKKINEVLTFGSRILKITYFLAIIICIYAFTLVLKEWKLVQILLSILRIVAPLFIGLLVAWLCDPFVKYLQKKGVRRFLGTAITYVIMLLFVYLVLASLIPLLSEQINEFAKTIPSVFDSIKTWINGAFDKLDRIENLDAIGMKVGLFKRIEQFGISLTQSLPEFTVNLVKTLFSGLGTIIIGLIIGFYLLLSFDNVSENLITLLPKRYRNDARELSNQVNTLLRRFVKGSVLDSLVVFIISSIGLAIVGLKSPILFGLFCGITNVIPYAGPYIGGVPAVIVGFSQSPAIGILSIVVLVVIQLLEGNFLQPIIMSRSTRIHPVTVMVGLLVFGYFFGILGMVISTPIIAVLKIIFNFIDEKYNLFHFNDEFVEE